MSWHITEDLDVFLARAGSFLRSQPVLHTLHLTVTERLRTYGSTAYGDEAPVFGVLERDGVARAAWFRTPPHWLTLTPLATEDAAALAVHLADLGHRLPGVSADRGTAVAFAEAWRRHTDSEVTLWKHQRLYRLDELTSPDPMPPGRARIVDKADRELLARWFESFATDVGVAIGNPGAWADARVEHGGALLWETPDGVPVSLAAAHPMVAGQVRVGPVYTPPEQRGRGYAAAVTVAVGRTVRAAGAEEVLLFADLANPTSNGVYQRVGYRGVADFAVYDFTGPQQPQPQGQSSSRAQPSSVRR
ncbi:predicted GNAT family acetyltransferase [Streptomyces sp. TLI_55]|uniref:GNAT family N-acetyltransferase n=1 Tax=Streptomyces sp. TLI_55 TaxID=1938861 RepID=UPI000BDCA636|nr:GNAT family N-acetyltransferase [Streptomyces sp. TLI_55]SNX61962.1 predicted GNAT family acetyltransferase [Streptomyces sp. TLI_55]